MTLDRLVAPQAASTEEEQLLATLRPKRLADFIGQDRARTRLDIALQAARMRGLPLDHLLVSGPPGLGKTTIANIVACELGGRMIEAFGPAMQYPGDLIGILNGVHEGDVLFIDEIHSMRSTVEEYLYVPMEDFKLQMMLGKGGEAEAISLPLPKFTVIGATTHKGAINGPLRERFGLDFVLDFYADADLARIVRRSALVMNLSVESDAAVMLAACGRGTPRVVNRLLRRVADVGLIEHAERITPEIVTRTLDLEGIEADGLDDLDRQFLGTLERMGGGPAGVASIAATMRQELVTVQDVVEPYLLYRGLIVRTSKGRQLTPEGFRRLRAGPLTSAA